MITVLSQKKSHRRPSCCLTVETHLWYGVLLAPFSLTYSTSCFWVRPLTEEFSVTTFSCHWTQNHKVPVKKQFIPVSEGGASSEEDGFGFGLWLVKQAEKRVIFHTDLPKDFTLVSTGHHELQRVLMRALKTENNITP